MYIIIINNYKRKLFLFCIITLFWISMFILSASIIKNKLLLEVTINNCISFSCPYTLQINEIYVNKNANAVSVETNLSEKKPSVRQFSNYTSLSGKFSFDYPSAFILDEKIFSGGDVLYHIDFFGKTVASHGFVQVWNLNEPLAQFLEKSKSLSVQSIKNFISKPITVKDLQGYLWDYTVEGNDGKTYKAMEAFFSKYDKMYRISYFVPLKAWNKTQSDIFWAIVNSLKLY